MDTELLDTFVHISKTRSFTKTAEGMCLTQAAVSARIKQLENLIGHPVFTRCKNSHTVHLTKSGHALLPFATDFINSWAMIRKEINNIHDTPILNISVHPALANLFFDKITILCDIERFQLNINQCNNMSLTESYYGVDTDLYISLTKMKSSQYENVHLGINQIGMLYNNLIEGSTLFVDWGDDINKKIKMNFTGNVSIKSDSPEFALNYILKNGGKCYLPLGMKIKQIKQDINYPIINIPIYAIFDKKNKSPTIYSFIELLNL
ncbi:LysR family transcriptional regulator [Salmonella enterica]|nr:LysR family transcriptional regulator [Salmonella enterica]